MEEFKNNLKKLAEKLEIFYQQDRTDDEEAINLYSRIIDLLNEEREKLGVEKIDLLKQEAKETLKEFGYFEGFDYFWDEYLFLTEPPVDGLGQGKYEYPKPLFFVRLILLILAGILIPALSILAIFFGSEAWNFVFQKWIIHW